MVQAAGFHPAAPRPVYDRSRGGGNSAVCASDIKNFLNGR